MRNLIVFVIFTLIFITKIFAQDSIPAQVLRIDAICDSIFSKKHSYSVVSFPYKWNNETDSIFYYFNNNRLVLVELVSDYPIPDDIDTEWLSVFAFQRFYFHNSRLCLEHHFYSSLCSEKLPIEESTKYIREKKTYFDVVTDKVFFNVIREIDGTWLTADSIIRQTKWFQLDIFYITGKSVAKRTNSIFKESNVIMPAVVIFPYDEKIN